jgi:hypothetical protein
MTQVERFANCHSDFSRRMVRRDAERVIKRNEHPKFVEYAKATLRDMDEAEAIIRERA